ncbi:acylphosphate phosphohydrolase, putative [Halarchaeum acidiphilum MH1-52-1]|uniref:acylphosphatase n=1 Tax=Halarchaeum acidiphilum MH1-52-1 TaxID=1261545 RepID=U3A4R6_9EURY|nr:acylphosphate phosphohydrolase, putative [Halarchaeum acidiphilum MH1-52-1]
MRAHVLVSGHVQGVYYRATTRETASDHGVDGWVENLSDGRVEAVFEGPEAAVESMVDWCHVGSRAADARTSRSATRSRGDSTGSRSGGRVGGSERGGAERRETSTRRHGLGLSGFGA